MDNKVEELSALENKKNPKNIHKDHYLRKRQPQKFEQGKEIIYVSSKSNIQVSKSSIKGYVCLFKTFLFLKALQDKCDKLINNNENEIIIHCLGAAVPHGILLALKICEKHPTFKSSVNTLTTTLTGDFTKEIEFCYCNIKIYKF